ncbi:hypothetical protein BGZ80_003535 [Entomortierella chlamydospora]|uniref:Arm-like repeat domain-containing protein n=1 Tax=Entomortierella chlamydospora TaxID=101097 RepID=A0A9P6N1X7_9FUNG|nr:hypothetical protein BGZ80_003535 [Entomortierella chlamydospora]
MIRNPFSPPSSRISIEDVLGLANKNIVKAHKEKDLAKAFQLSTKAESFMKDAEKIFINLNNDLAKTYQEHGKLLDELGHHDKAQEIQSRAKEWRQIHDLIQRFISSGQLTHQDHTLHTSQTGPIFATAIDVVHIQPEIFHQNVAPPTVKFVLPGVSERIASTPQLAYCLSLLRPSLISGEGLCGSESDWLQTRVNDADELKRLQSMATDLIRAFVRDELKKPNVVAEVVSLAAVLQQDDFRKLLQAFVDGIDQSVLLEVHLLDGLAQLIRNSVQGYLDPDDLIKILELLNTRLKNTHRQSVQHTYRLAQTISQVLDSMVDSQVKGLSREQLHEPLSDYLKGLQQSSDPYLAYQAAYAFQTLQHIPDDETILQSMIRRTGKVVRGISGMVSAVKALDLVGFVEGLQNIQKSLADAGSAMALAREAYTNAKTLAQSGQGLSECLKESLNFACKSVWYPALRGLDALLREGRFTEFEKLVRGAPCRHDPTFQWGMCQRLGEIAANPLWDANVRKSAVTFLGELYKDDITWNQHANTKHWILRILGHLVESPKGISTSNAKALLQELQLNSGRDSQSLLQGSGQPHTVPYPLVVTQLPEESLLLAIVQNKPDVETSLGQLKRERLKDRDGDVYISPRAKASPKATEDFDLRSKIQEFFDGDRKVFLILGDSGAGKSTFNRALEIDLWDKYNKTVGQIPLFIHLPTIERPERDLVGERLRRANFTESQISELKVHHEFILICDGYDEIQETRNLYVSNQLNQPGEWRAQMVISCRTEYNGTDYKGCFQPIDRNTGGGSELFEEAIITPFNKNQIHDYVDQYVSLRKPLWGSENYLQALREVPNLQDLVRNPFLLRLALEVLPQLFSTSSTFSESHITRVQLYDEFVAQWIERSKTRLREMDLSSRDKDAFKGLSDYGFNQLGITYLKELVTAIYDNQSGNPVVNYLEYRDRSTWKEALFNNEDGRNLLREAIPLTRNGHQYRFIHKSVLEYGMALAVCDPSEYDENTELTSTESRRASTSSILSFESFDSLDATAKVIGQSSLKESPLGKRLLVHELSVLQFLTERVHQQPKFKEQLYSVIEQSKTDKKARVAAANAITILIRAGVQFNGTDLRGIKVPGADLSNGVFDSAQLEGADLRSANLQNIWLRQANLSGAQMAGVQFGELPFLEDEEGRAKCCDYSPDGATFAIGFSDGKIILYETSSWDIIHVLSGHSDTVTGLAYSASCNRIVSSSEDKTVRLWNVESGECIYVLKGHTEIVATVAFSPDEGQIASGSEDKTVRLWDIATGECTHTLKEHKDWVNAVMYSPNGVQLASVSDEDVLRLWNVGTGELIHTLKGHEDFINGVTFSPDGTHIASGSGDSTVRIWNVDTGDCIRVLSGHQYDVRGIAYSPKGDRIASTSDDATIRLWNVDTGECIHVFQDHTARVNSVVFLPKGDRIASASEDKSVRLWDVSSGDCLQALQGHGSKVYKVLCSPKGDRIASRDTVVVRLWDINTNESTHTSMGHRDVVRSIAHSPQENRVASASDDLTVRLWNAHTGEFVKTLQGHTEWVQNVTYSPNGHRIATGSYDTTIRLWDASSGDHINTLQGHTEYINSVVYSPDGDLIASGSDDKTVRLWNAATGECVRTLRGHKEEVLHAAYSPKGDTVASTSADKTLRIWNVTTGDCLYAFNHSEDVVIVVYSPTGDQVASGSFDETVQLWDVNTGDWIHTLQGHSDYITCLMYSPKGGQIASGSRDNTIRLWNVASGRCVRTLEGHHDQVISLAYSPSGEWIASGSHDNTLRLWKADTGECVTTVSGFNGAISCMSWENTTSEGLYLVTGSWDKSIRRWRFVEDGNGGYKAILSWSSSHEVLTVSGTNFSNVQGLTRLNSQLLTQRAGLQK